MNTHQPNGNADAPRPNNSWPTSVPPPQAAMPHQPFPPDPWAVPRSGQPYAQPYAPPAGPPSPPIGGGFGAQPPFGPMGTPVREPRFSREQIVAALLAAAGIGVTLIGVVLLLAMAAREGLLTPPVRVGGGAILTAALAGAALWVRPRPGGRIGSLALLTTAAAGAFFIVVAVTRIYTWIPLTAGLALALLVAGAAGMQALRWDEKWLFIAVTLGVSALAPYLTDGIDPKLVGFLAVIQLAGVLPEVTKNWDEIALARTAPVALVASTWIAFETTQTRTIVFTAAAVAAIGLLTAVQAGLTRRDAIGAPIALGMSWMPLWVFAATSDQTTRALVSAVMTLVALAGFALLRNVASTVRLATLVLAGVSAVILLVTLANGDWRAVPFFAIAIILMVVHTRRPVKLIGLLSIGALALGVAAQTSVTPFGDLFYRSRVAEFSNEGIVAGLLMAVFAVVALVAVHGKGMDAPYVQGVLAVAGASGAVGLSMAALIALGGTSTGFFIVHLAITVLALALAATVLLAGLSRPRHLTASMNWGLALVACALLKLFCFDLHYMGTMTKALTFVAAGLVLLAAGTKYARAYADVSAARKANVAADDIDSRAPAAF